MDSDDEIQQQPVERTDTAVPKGTYRTKAVKEAEAALPRKKKVPTQKQLDALNANRSKALEKLTEMRRAKAAEKAEVKKITEEVKLDRAPKVREIDTSMAVIKAEMEALKKELAESRKVVVKPVEEKVEPKRKVKKVVYENEEDEEEIIEVVRKKVPAKAKSITGTELLDKLFFNQ